MKLGVYWFYQDVTSMDVSIFCRRNTGLKVSYLPFLDLKSPRLIFNSFFNVWEKLPKIVQHEIDFSCKNDYAINLIFPPIIYKSLNY